jgi:hypothetical protein
MIKQSNNSTSTIKGFIYQFLVALKKCFELQDGETVYIETFGDVSILGNADTEQIESKFYKEDLTDLDHNVWNTLNNWLKDEFPLDSFSSLVLLTTQKIKSSSLWFGWNEKSIAEKKMILQKIVSKYTKRKINRDPKTEKLLSSVLDVTKSEKLNVVLKKMVIDHGLNDVNIYNSIKEIHAKTIHDIRKDEFIRCMLGYVISPTTVNNNWEITYKNFTQEVISLAASLNEKTTQFPSKLHLKDIKTEEYNENNFVNKIHQIEYDEVVLDAISEYVQTKEMLISEIHRSKTISRSLDEYVGSLHSRQRTEYRMACRNCIEVQKIISSQNFYDKMMSSEEGSFYIYNSVPRYFHNGMLHILAEENDNFIWLLR